MATQIPTHGGVALYGQERDTDGNPKSEYIARLAGMTDADLYAECKDKIILSAYAANNPLSDLHWQCDATYDECSKRGKVDDVYSKAHAAISRQARWRD